MRSLTTVTCVILSISIAAPGCTSAVWSGTSPTIYGAHLRAIADAPKSHPAPSQQQLVLVYCTGDGGPLSPHKAFYLTLPMPPGDPFLYRGNKRTPRDILLDIHQPQRREIMAANLPSLDREKAHNEPDSRREDSAGARLPSWNHPRGSTAWTRTYYADPQYQLALIAICPAITDVGQLPSATCSGAGAHDQLPEGCTILIVPNEQPRPAGDLAAARLTAAALTTLTAPLDVAVAAVAFPILLIAVLTGTAPKC